MIAHDPTSCYCTTPDMQDVMQECTFPKKKKKERGGKDYGQDVLPIGTTGECACDQRMTQFKQLTEVNCIVKTYKQFSIETLNRLAGSST